MARSALTDDEVAAIRVGSDRTDMALARQFGVSAPTVRKARLGVSYRHVKVAPRLEPGGGGVKHRRKS